MDNAEQLRKEDEIAHFNYCKSKLNKIEKHSKVFFIYNCIVALAICFSSIPAVIQKGVGWGFITFLSAFLYLGLSYWAFGKIHFPKISYIDFFDNQYFKFDQQFFIISSISAWNIFSNS